MEATKRISSTAFLLVAVAAFGDEGMFSDFRTLPTAKQDAVILENFKRIDGMQAQLKKVIEEIDRLAEKRRTLQAKIAAEDTACLALTVLQADIAATEAKMAALTSDSADYLELQKKFENFRRVFAAELKDKQHICGGVGGKP